MKIKIMSLFIILTAVILSSCVATFKVAPNDYGLKKEVEYMFRILKPKFDNKTEEIIAVKQAYGFFSVLKQIKGKDKWNKFLQDFDDTNSITKSFLNVYDKSFYEIAAIINYKLDTEMPTSKDAVIIRKDIGDLEVIYIQGSKAERDLIYIKYLLDKYYSEMKEYYQYDRDTEKRYKRNIDNILGNKVKVYLLTDKKYVERFFGNFRGTAASSVGYAFKGDKQLFLKVEMLYKYHDLFTAYTFAHEAAHILWALSFIDPEHTKPLHVEQAKNENKKKEFFEALKGLTHPGPLKEGAAEYVASKYNILYKSGILEDIDSQIAYYFKKKNISFDLAKLPKNIHDSNDRFFAYEIAHSVFKHIVKQYSKDKAFLLAASEETDQSYQKILGKSIRELSMEWNEKILNLL